ncbi:MAG TPA: acyl-CoA desaturase [Cytophagales bacterium]|nr:acyl-CoA desaturase [Cytophagales bacterium]
MKIKFQNNNHDFHNAVSTAVHDYFEDTGKSPKANMHLYIKTFTFFSIFLGAYLSLLFGGFDLWVNNILWIVIGLSAVFLAVNCGHDAIHGAYSQKKWVNRLMSNTYNILGANSYLWSIQHNIVHHTYTNIEGADEDIQAIPFARLSPVQKWRPIQRYQHIWVFILYAFGTLFWVFSKDYKKFFQKSIGNYDNSKHPKIQYFNLFFFKLVYYTIFIFLPVYMIDMPWYQVVGGFVLGHLFEGLAVATIFALAHVVERTQFPIPDHVGSMENNWAIHQMYTTANFGTKSKITSFFTGGLNFQIEHHLFPQICHVHYPVLSEIVKKKAWEFQIPYIEYTSFYDALKSHMALLKQLGNNTFDVKLQKGYEKVLV